VVALLGLRLAPEKTRVVHIDEGFHFLGHHIRRQRKRGTSKYYVYTMPSKKAIRSIKGKVSEQTYRSTRHMELDRLRRSLNQTLRGWAIFFRYWGVQGGVQRCRLPRMGSADALDTRQVCGQTPARMKELGAASVAVELPLSRRHHRDPVGPRTRQPPPQAVDQRERHVERPVHREAHAGCCGRGPAGNDGGDTGTAPVGLPHRPCCFVPARTGRGRRPLICVLAQHCPSWFDDLWITDATPVPCGMSPETVKRSKPGRARRLRLLRVTLPVVLGPEAVPGVHGRRDAGHVVPGQPQDRGT
jgi:hypothetical protein